MSCKIPIEFKLDCINYRRQFGGCTLVRKLKTIWNNITGNLKSIIPTTNTFSFTFCAALIILQEGTSDYCILISFDALTPVLVSIFSISTSHSYNAFAFFVLSLLLNVIFWQVDFETSFPKNTTQKMFSMMVLFSIFFG